ncbi:MAG: hypothetical protein J0H34_02465 [Rhizobiales bacterium]|nr:hypothetical protein [Hyphomicrobiales bacterium]
MIKFIAAAVWIVAVTLGTVFYSFQQSRPEPEAAASEEHESVSLDYLRTETLSVPVVRDGTVIGYFITKLAFSVDRNAMAKLALPANTLVTDALYTYLFGSPEIDFTNTKKLDLPAFKAHIRESINGKAGKELVQDIAVEQLEYLTKDEIRDNALRRKTAQAKKTKAAEKASSEHAGEGEASGH